MKKFSIFCFCYFFFTVSATAFTISSKEVNQLKEKFEQVINTQNEAFARLEFTLTEDKISTSQTFKIILKDQFGRKWMFKDSSQAGALAIYKMSTFLGVPTPEIHPYELKVNDTLVQGSLQRLIPDTKTFEGNYFELPDSSINYLLNSHFISWLSLNHHVHRGQFIINSEKELLRIDNSVNYSLIDIDSMAPDYVSPLLNHIPYAGYVDFWNFVIKNTSAYRESLAEFGIFRGVPPRVLEIDYKTVLARAALVTSMSDNDFVSFFQLCIDTNFISCTNNAATSDLLSFPFGYMTANKKDFSKKMILRKKMSYKKLLSLYQSIDKLLDKKGNMKLAASDVDKLKTQLMDYYNLKLDEANEDLKKTENVTQKMAVIASPVDYESFKIIQRVSTINLMFGKLATIDHIKRISDFMHTQNEKFPREANLYAIENLKNLAYLAEANEYDKNKLWLLALNAGKFFEKDYVKNNHGFQTTLSALNSQ